MYKNIGILLIVVLFFLNSCSHTSTEADTEEKENLLKAVISFSYDPFIIEGTIGQEISSVSPLLTPGNANVRYQWKNSAPPGIYLAPISGKISGIPSMAIDSVYTIQAKGIEDSQGMAFSQVSIRISALSLSSIAYSVKKVSVQRLNSIKALFPQIEPPEATVTYDISPNLPNGMRFNENGKGSISGSPKEVSNIIYTITATGTGTYKDTAHTKMNIEVLQIPTKPSKPQPSSIKYPVEIIEAYIQNEVGPYNPQFRFRYAQLYMQNKIGPFIPQIEPPEATVTYSISPNLPHALRFNENGRGIITGYPLETTDAVYVVTATGIGDFEGSVSTSISIQISKISLVSLDYPNNNIDIKALSSFKIQPQLNPPNAEVTYSIDSGSSHLSEFGLEFNEKGVFSGTPKRIFDYTYTITATGTGRYQGSVSTNVRIKASEIPITGLSYPSQQLYGKFMQSITPFRPTVRPAGASVQFSITPCLSGTGLSFHHGVISGTPTRISMRSCTITARGVDLYSGTITIRGISIFIDVNYDEWGSD